MKTGARLYTVRDYTQTEKDFARTIERIVRIGYTTVQISAIGPNIKPKCVKEICDDSGLCIVLTHSNPDRILNDTEALIEEHNKVTILLVDFIGRFPVCIIYFDYT